MGALVSHIVRDRGDPTLQRRAIIKPDIDLGQGYNHWRHAEDQPGRREMNQNTSNIVHPTGLYF